MTTNNTESNTKPITFLRIHHHVKDAKGRDIMDYLYCNDCWVTNKEKLFHGMDTYKTINHWSDRCDICNPLIME